jgi:hypothetical protein
LALESLDDRIVPSIVDLTHRGTVATDGDAIVRQGAVHTTANGHNHTFLRIEGNHHRNGSEQGFNTTARPAPLDDVGDPKALTTGQVPRVTLDGTDYREFDLNIHENFLSPKLSLDSVEVFFANTPDLTGFDPATGTLQAADGSRLQPSFTLADPVLLNGRLGHSRGSADMLLDVPDTAFMGTTVDTYVYLYSKLGGLAGTRANCEAEQWSVRPTGVTQPPVSATGSLSGHVFADGVGLDGVAIQLTGTDVNGHQVSISATTAGGGVYSFTGLLPGTYSILEGSTFQFISDHTNIGTVNGSTDGSLGTSGGFSNLSNIVSINLGVNGFGLNGTGYDFYNVSGGGG